MQCSQWGFAASTMTPLSFWALPYPNFPKLSPTCTGSISVRLHPYAHPQHIKVLKHIYIQYRCEMHSEWWFTASTMTTTKSFYPNFQKLTPNLHSYSSLSVHPYALPQHMKIHKHFVYTQYGCGMQWMVVLDSTMTPKSNMGSALVPQFSNHWTLPTQV